MFIDPAEAIQMARDAAGESDDARAKISENEDGYLVGFNNGISHVATMTKIWYWVDKTTGKVSPVGAAIVSELAASLRPLDL